MTDKLKKEWKKYLRKREKIQIAVDKFLQYACEEGRTMGEIEKYIEEQE
jgi:hypothetical protein